MKTRLIELVKQACEEAMCRTDGLPCTYEDIADYLLDNGVIVPPVRIGQTMWFAGRYYGKVYPITIGRIDIEDDGMMMIDDDFSVWSDTDVGERIFFTREAAEEALKTRGI